MLKKFEFVHRVQGKQMKSYIDMMQDFTYAKS